MNYVKTAMEQAAELIMQACDSAIGSGELPQAEGISNAIIEIPKDTKNGDYASSFAMQSAKKFGVPPRKIAEAICNNAKLEGTLFCELTIAGPGFLNLRLGSDYFCGVLKAIETEGDKYGYSETPTREKIMVEFVSANPTGPMHMGNARGGVLGDSLAEVLARAGNDVTREFYVNDAGNQIEKFALSLKTRYAQIINGEDSVVLPEDCYQGEDIRELAQEFYNLHGDKYLSVPDAECHDEMVKFGLERNLIKMREDLQKYKINYDNWFFESKLHDENLVEETINKLVDAGATYESEGALWLKTTDFGCEKDDVLRRANGFFTYFAADIAYHREKFEKRHFDRVINIWGADHHGHVARLKAALDVLGLDGTNRLQIVLMQLVRLMRDGEVVRMSKRTGKAITLSDLLDEISCDAARYFFNSRAADTHLEFDLGLAVREDSDNPVYYVQYAHARVKSLLANLAAEGISVDGNADFALLQNAEELDLIRELARLPEEIRLAASSREPSRMNRYAITVAAAFHRFYTSSKVKNAETAELRLARVGLINCVATVIENTLSTFGVSAPDHM